MHHALMCQINVEMEEEVAHDDIIVGFAIKLMDFSKPEKYIIVQIKWLNYIELRDKNY